MDSNQSLLSLGPRYQVIRNIGRGTYGSVYEALDTETNTKVAIKNIKALFDYVVEAKHLLREILIMRTLNHPNIIKIRDIVIPPGSEDFDTVFIVMEFAEADLKQLAKSPTFLDRDQVRFLMYQSICGCRYMHSANVLHRDLKPANILINSNCSLKICDFGLSRSYLRLNQPFQDQVDSLRELNPDDMELCGNDFRKKKATRLLTGHVVTRWYRAPEVILLEKEYGKEMDVWSLGCVFAEMLGMLRENIDSHVERSPLFPGKSCFPLSPNLNSRSSRGGYPCDEFDQLNMIFEVIGTPVGDDLEFITDPKALRYVQSFPPTRRRDLREYLPGLTDDELSLLSQMLQFSPRKRITLEQALNHPYFANLRAPQYEQCASAPADFIFDREQEMDTQTLRELFRREVATFYA